MKVATGEYPPWSSKDFKHGGFVHHIISEAFKRKGYKVVFIYHKWARSYKEGLLGNVDATAYMKYYNLERLHTANENMSPVNFEQSQRKVSGLV
ncbi:hypothetical protein [Spartinivicinus ruber]|uniref:hypothetical protein n=1 Tax=Spartinivicinus ruber TaxID=2683272 RepID=UPI0013D31963|nr:hypothetical protein [Spartinivicinus ruber]